jgi:hypothetical protein
LSAVVIAAGIRIRWDATQGNDFLYHKRSTPGDGADDPDQKNATRQQGGAISLGLGVCMTAASRLGSIEQVTALLQEVYPNAGFSSQYLHWLYKQAPDGARDGADHIEQGNVLGHYALVPQVWREGSSIHRLALVLNLAVSKNATRKGIANIFIRLGREAYDSARGAGIEAVHGVANANSTLGVTKRLGMTPMPSLPVTGGVVAPWSPGRVASYAADRRFLDSRMLEDLVASIDHSSDEGFVQDWTLEKLRWRLSSPKTAYAVHVADSGILVSCATHHAGLPIAVALKFLLRRAARIIKTHQLLAAAARFHRTPFFIYAGFSSFAKVTGMRLPRRFLPSPLNLAYLALADSMPAGPEMRYAAFEFLDFDAY